jgi:pimeloyl-ACP methyl ester carboxylesterase
LSNFWTGRASIRPFELPQIIAANVRDEYSCNPVAIGASPGGISSLMAQHAGNHDLLEALVLLDIAPRMHGDGVDKIIGFVSERMEEGFASLQEAANNINSQFAQSFTSEVAGWAVEESTPRSGWPLSLALGSRAYYWAQSDRGRTRANEESRIETARALTIPTLLVHGRNSELITSKQAREFRELVPHAVLADVSGAGHMIAGARNDLFMEAVIEFLNGLTDRKRGQQTDGSANSRLTAGQLTDGSACVLTATAGSWTG